MAGYPARRGRAMNMAEAATPNKAETPKSGDKVENTIMIRTRAMTATPTHDEDAKEQFLSLYKGKKVENVALVSKVHDIGTGITYVFSADVK